MQQIKNRNSIIITSKEKLFIKRMLKSIGNKTLTWFSCKEHANLSKILVNGNTLYIQNYALAAKGVEISQKK